MAGGIFGEPWFIITIYTIVGIIAFITSFSCNRDLFFIYRTLYALVAGVFGPFYIFYFIVFKEAYCGKQSFLD